MKSEEDRRGYFRVVTEFPVSYRVIVPGEPRRYPTEILYHVPSLPVNLGAELNFRHEDQPSEYLTELLLWMDWKINFLIKTITKARDEELFPERGVIANLSASGLSLKSSRNFPRNTFLEFELILPVVPFKELLLTGEVVRDDPGERRDAADQPYQLGVDFREIKEADREQIIRYVVKRQMELQREHQA